MISGMNWRGWVAAIALAVLASGVRAGEVSNADLVARLTALEDQQAIQRLVRDGSKKTWPYEVPFQLMHIMSGASYELTGKNSARGGAYWTQVAVRDGTAQLVGSGRYVDELRKVDGHWKFTRRAIYRDVPLPTPAEIAVFEKPLERSQSFERPSQR